MPKDFNEFLTKDRSFVVQDKTFSWHDVAPEVLVSFADELSTTNGKDERSQWEIADAQILLFIEPTQHDMWKELRARTENPVTILQIQEIVTWLMETQTTRPTEAPSPSASGRGKGAASSSAA